jgi:hypothetical protein
MKLWVSLCFYYVENRLENFKRTINNLSNIPNIKITVDSNVNFDSNLDIRVTQLADPYHYTWEHKKYMPEFLNSDYTHFAYLEGNIGVTKKTFDYWIKTREMFLENNRNFIPAVHRIQKDKEGNIYSLDCTHKQTHSRKVILEGQEFVFLSEPYQGMFIMDKEMVKEHIDSGYYSLGHKHTYGIRESANLGNIYVNVPPNLPHRAALPLNIPDDCMVEHFGTDYHGDVNSPHAKIKIEDLFK